VDVEAGAGSAEARLGTGIRWLVGAAVTAVIAINAAGISGIAVARRGLIEEAERSLRLETDARARALESVLASTRGDLAFLTGSPVFNGLEAALGSRDPREVRWRRLDAEGALLLFLRGHPEVARLVARSVEGRALVEAGRRGGVPVLWVSGREGAAVDPVETPLTGRFEFTAGIRKISGAVTLEATLDPGRLIGHGPAAGKGAARCALRDANGAVLAAEGQAVAEGETASPESGAVPSGSGSEWIKAETAVGTEGWSAPSPWKLACRSGRGPALALVDPVANRYRMTLVLNLAAMSLALVLGAFTIQQARRRQRLEARAREEARVRELERQLFHAERLSTVGRLAAGMAHEINNPLEGMSNYLGLARDEVARGDAAAAQKRLEGVHEGLQRVSAVVRQVLAHADPATAPKVVLDVNAVLRQSVEFVRSRPEFRGIQFDLLLHDGALTVRGVQAPLGQVFLNLVLNACEAQPQGGEVRVTSKREGGKVLIAIADRGPGVPEADSARIFEPFFSTKQSSGLGLSICYSIVTQHGGELGVENRQGGGALFRMSFPAVDGGLGRVEGSRA
jgi:signal transduction histidine kinase